MVACCKRPKALSSSERVKTSLSIILVRTAMTSSCFVGAIRTSCWFGVIMKPNQVLEDPTALFFQLNGHPNATRKNKIEPVKGSAIFLRSSQQKSSTKTKP